MILHIADEKAIKIKAHQTVISSITSKDPWLSQEKRKKRKVKVETFASSVLLKFYTDVKVRLVLKL